MASYTIEIPVTTKINILTEFDMKNDVANIDIENNVLIMNDGSVFRMIDVTGLGEDTPSYVLRDIKYEQNEGV